MTILLLQDIEEVFFLILIQLAKLIIPIISVYTVFWFIRDLTFKE